MRQSLATFFWLSSPFLSGGSCAAPELINEKRVLHGPNEFWTRNHERSSVLRLSPDGTRLLFLRAVTPNGPGRGRRAMFRLMIREVGGNADTELPVAPYRRHWATVHTRFNPFDPGSSTLALNERGKKGPLLMYDIVSQKVERTSIEDKRVVFARFDAKGKNLIVTKGEGLDLFTASLPQFELTRLNISGVIHSVCPSAPVICLLRPRNEEGTRKESQALVLYDVAEAKQIADLPLNERNAIIDDVESQWTQDGRYLYYCDLVQSFTDRNKTRYAVRVWDRLHAREVCVVDAGHPIGPGPISTAMVLSKRQGANRSMLVHDAETGDLWRVGQMGLSPQHACGRYVVYITLGPDGEEAAYVAEISMAGHNEPNLGKGG